jgi:predicted DNA-binding protein
MATVKFVLRYSTEQQKSKLEKIAKNCGRSANSHIVQLIEKEITENKHLLKLKK